MQIQTTKDWAMHFLHLPLFEVEEIHVRILNARSMPILFSENGIPKFCVIFDSEIDSVHVRHIGGSFAWRWKWIEKAATLICKMTYKNKITVLAQEKFMIHAVNKLGFSRVNEEEFEKVIA